MSQTRASIHDIEGQGVSSWTMSPLSPTIQGFQFGVFDLDLKTGELRKEGRLIHLRNQPFQVLALLLERAGELVTRDEIKAALWAEEADVDVEQGLNYCIKEIRSALGDNADAPRFVQTLPRRGYRFLGEVRRAHPKDAIEEKLKPPAEAPPAGFGSGQPAAEGHTHRDWFAGRGPILLAALFALGAVLAFTLWNRREPPPATAAGQTRLVVLPFVDLSPKVEGFLADGLTDELIGSLGRRTRGRLGVIARSTSLAYRLRPPDPMAFARELGAAYFIEGTVRREATNLRVSVALARASDGTQLWSETYDRRIEDLLAIESEIASAVAAGVRVAVNSESGKSAANNSEAYLEYLRGRFLWNQRSKTSMLESFRIFEGLATSHPDFAPGFAGLADSYVVLMDYGHVSPRDSWTRALAAAERAVALDPGLAEAWTTLGMIRGLYEWNSMAANEAFARAAALNPNYTTRLHWQALLLRAEGRHKDALLNLEAARQLDPLSLVIRSNLSGLLVEMGRVNEGLQEAESLVSLAPSWAPGQLRRGEALSELGRAAEAEAAYIRAARAGIPTAQARLAAFYATTGRTAEAGEMVRQLEAQARSGYVPPYLIAKAAATLDPEKAFRSLEAAVEERSPFLRLLRRDPDFAALRKDPRFQRMVEVLWPGVEGASR